MELPQGVLVNGLGSGGGEGESVSELSGIGGGKEGRGLRGVLGAEEDRGSRRGGGGGGGGGPELLSVSEVLEEREVEEEETETDDKREDFLSGTLGLGRLPEGDLLMRAGTGVPAVGVLDWLE